VENGSLHVLANAGESLGLNSTSLPFTAPAGTSYTFAAHAGIPTSSVGGGCLILSFQDANFTELHRVSFGLRPQPLTLGTAQTLADGSFVFALGSPPAGAYTLWADYPGSATLGPAAASLTIGIPPLGVVAASLPAGKVGIAYAQTLAASGGLAPYTWVGSGWPPGLTLHSDGSLTGTPTAAGLYSASVSVIDQSTPTQIVDVSLAIVVE